MEYSFEYALAFYRRRDGMRIPPTYETSKLTINDYGELLAVTRRRLIKWKY